MSLKIGEARRPVSNVFEELGIAPVINCCGIYTDLGGSILSSSVFGAVEQLNRHYVRMTDLMDSAGSMIANLVGAEAARVTPGCSAALALSVGATMTGDSGKLWERLPDTTGMKNELLIANAHLRSYRYLQPARLSGCKVVPFGPADRFDIESFPSSVTQNSACILVPAHLLDGFSPAAEQLSKVCEIAHAISIPVVVDAAYISYPINLLQSFAKAGVDLTCFSAKYFYGPNSGGFVSGRRALIAAVEGLDFTRYESGRYRAFGRSFKMSRYDVAATAIALRDWVAADHEERWRIYHQRVQALQSVLNDGHGAYVARPANFTLDERIIYDDVVNALAIKFLAGEEAAKAVASRLQNNVPIVESVVQGDTLILAVETLQAGEDEVVAEYLEQAIRDSVGTASGL